MAITDTNSMPAYEVTLEIQSTLPISDEALEATTDAVMAAFHREAAFAALGPVATLHFDENVIEVLCTVTGESPEDLHSKIGCLYDVMLGAANTFEYRGGATHKVEDTAPTTREPVPA